MKITEYMAAGLPVIASGGGETEKMMVESQGGIHIPFRVEAFVQAVLELLQNRDRYQTMQTAAQAYAKTLTWDEIGKTFARFMADTMKTQ
jgi:glycosyltransferase involved in cell wall biosynthesis